MKMVICDCAKPTYVAFYTLSSLKKLQMGFATEIYEGEFKKDVQWLFKTLRDISLNNGFPTYG